MGESRLKALAARLRDARSTEQQLAKAHEEARKEFLDLCASFAKERFGFGVGDFVQWAQTVHRKVKGEYKDTARMYKGVILSHNGKHFTVQLHGAAGNVTTRVVSLLEPERAKKIPKALKETVKA